MNRFTPRRATLLATFLAVVAVLDVAWGATHHRAVSQSTEISCAMVLTHNGQECRP